MARVPYPEAEPGSDLAAIYADIAGLRGRIVNLNKALANQPPALRAFMAMSRHVRNASSLPGDVRELAILAVAYALDAPYEQAHHIPVARREGVSEEKLAAFPDWATCAAFTPTERAVLAYADQVTRTRDADDATFEELRRHLTLAQITDLTVTVAWYHLCAAIIGPLRIELDDEPA
jgi:alkylhydroperoxidase family enzyme